jgi:hypothetical protein
MGWDTYLSVNQRMLQAWRKHAPSHPRLLFHDADLVLVEPSVGVDCVVQYRTTADQAVRTLDERGITWDLCVAHYLESGVNTGMVFDFLCGYLGSQAEHGSRSQADVDAILSAFQSRDPSTELTEFAEFLVDNWENHREGDGCVLHGWLESSWAADEHGWADWDEVLSLAEKYELPNAYTLAKTAEYLAHLGFGAPTLAWLVVLRTILHVLPADTEIELELSEDAARRISEEDIASAAAYAEEYWERSAASLADQATFYARLYSVLEGAASTTGPEYARARARSLLQDCLRTSATGKAKGDLLEDLLEAIVEISRPKLIVIERNLRTPQEELDLVVTNHLSDPFWVALQSPAIFIECKNWKSAVGIDELRVFETKLADHASLCKVGVFVALHGFTAPFKRRLRELQAQGRTVFALTATDLQQAIEHRDGLPGWLMQHGVRRLLSSETTPTE